MTLKPCPFCDGKPWTCCNMIRDIAFIRCRECESEGPAVSVTPICDWEAAKGRAAELWNTRADERKVGS